MPRSGIAQSTLRRRTLAAARVARYAWAAPCTAVGLCLVAPALPFGACVQVVDGVIEVGLCARRTPVPRLLHALPFTAITFGHLVIAISSTALDELRAHEHAHVRQYERWGPLFFAAYPAASLWQWLKGNRAY